MDDSLVKCKNNTVAHRNLQNILFVLKAVLQLCTLEEIVE